MKNILEKIVSLLFLIVNFFLGIIAKITVNMIIPEEFVDINMISNITNPQQVIWRSSDRIIFVTDEDIWEYVVSENSSIHIGKRKPNEFIGVGVNGQILLCSIEHFTISSYDEFSTKFVVKEYNKDEEIEMSFFETIRPIYLDSKKILAVTAVDFLERHFYEIDTKNGEMKEIEEPRSKITPIYIPDDIDVKEIYSGEDGKHVIEDVFGNVYLLIKKRDNYPV
jgi:hypothetical protein